MSDHVPKTLELSQNLLMDEPGITGRLTQSYQIPPMGGICFFMGPKFNVRES
jgi:hypothetical protein